MELEERSTPSAKVLDLGRLAVLLVGSLLGIAAFWHVVYGASVLTATAMVVEVVAILILAFAYAWRSTR
jgi:hypothetical protein